MPSPGRTRPRKDLWAIFTTGLHMVGLEFWIVAFGPFYLGWGVASARLFPDFTVILGMVVIGPLLGGYTFLFNDYWDRNMDRDNWRKSITPFQVGMLSPGTVLASSVMLFVMGVALAFYLDTLFGVVMTMAAVLSGLYSHPATKLKARAGYDIATNVVGVGVLCPLGGWVLGGGTLREVPVFYIVSMALIIGGFYAPTTVADLGPDRKHGLRTLAVRLGVRRTLVLAQVLLSAGVLCLIIEGWFDYVMAREVMLRILPFIAVQPVIYFVAFRRPGPLKIFWSLFISCVLSGLGSVVFLAYNAGIWSL